MTILIKYFIYVIGLPDIVLLWRGIVRHTHETLRHHLNPTRVAASVLLEKANHIAQTEENEGRLKAVDQLIYTLLKLKSLRWTISLPKALEKQHRDMFDDLTKAREDLLKEEVFSRCRYNVTDTVSADVHVLKLQKFGVRLEIPAGALQQETDISVSVISPKNDHPPLGDNFIVAPMVMLEPDGLQFLRSVTLTVKHSGMDLKLRHLQVWKKTNNKGKAMVCAYEIKKK